jgi:MFS family permease
MSIGPFKRRSSLPSSFITGLIGWNGFFIIIGAVLGVANRAGELFILGTAAAICQIIFLRLLFFDLRLDRGMAAGAFWGGLTGVAAVIVEKQFSDIFAAHSTVWVLNGVYIGTAVGLFLGYFYRDDRRIEEEAKQLGRKVDYGRDAHWLEPFFFGVVAYLIAFVPQSFSLAVNISVVGAMSGVVAAGVSHFFLFTVARRSFVPVVLSILAGVIQGTLSGLLFRSFATSLLFSPLVHGAVAGTLTYLITSLRGRALASKESVAVSS